MKKLKMVLWLIVIGLVVLIVYQNRAYFSNQEVLSVTLPVTSQHYETPSLPNGVILLLFFVLGLLTSFFLGLTGRMRTKREVRSLKTTINSQMDIIAALKKEIELVKDDQGAASSSDLQMPNQKPFNGSTRR